MVRTLNKQFDQRIKNLPEGIEQVAEIDIRGQKVSKEILEKIFDRIKKYDEVRFIDQ